ncbi:MAG: glycogen/starch/alpha-glucan phosphorylase, partial [Nodosilinea sp.]
HDQFGVLIDPASLFDVQVKRIHEYKRQHLNVLHIVTLYHQLKQNPNLDITPRTFIFGGKAAPGYTMAKLMIKLITAVGDMINKDPDLRNRIKVIFLPNYNVTNSQRIYPASDLSEQISTAGYEASGTGNMKFAMNGALTIGTLDGANIEIRDAVGAENFFLFGLTTEQVIALKAEGYQPHTYYQTNPLLKETIDLIASGHFSQGDGSLFRPLVDKLLHQDPFMLMADYQAYIDCQQQVGQAYSDSDHWTRMSIFNALRMGGFSSDRSIREYCQDIWQASPFTVPLAERRQTTDGKGGELTCQLS